MSSKKNLFRTIFIEHPALWILIITGIAFMIRAWGVGFGLPHAYHPDEPKALVYIKNCWDGNFSPYPLGWDPLYGAYTFIVFFFQKIFYLLIKVLGYHPFLESFKDSFKTSDAIYIIGRTVTALTGALTVAVTYLIGSRLFNRRVGIVASLFLCFSLSHIENSHFIKPDVPITLFIALTFLFAILIYQTGRWWSYLLTGLLAGISLATKINGISIIITGIIAHLLYIHKEGKGWFRIFFDRNIFIFSMAILLGVFLGCPYIYSDFNGFLGLMKWYIEDQARGRGPIFFRWGWVHFLKCINYGMGLPVAFLSYAGVLFSLASGISSWTKRNHNRILMVSFPLFYYLISGKSTFVATRYTILVIPFLSVIGADFLDSAINRIFKKGAFHQYIYPLLLIPFLVYPIYNTLVSDYFFWEKDTRDVACVWINRNIPPGSSIATENYCPWISKKRYNVGVSLALGFQPVKNYQELGYQYLITSNFAHDRYIHSQKKDEYPQYVNFYNDLKENYHLLKEFDFKPVGFSNPRIRIYKLEKREAGRIPYISYPPQGDSLDKEFYALNGDPSYRENLKPFNINYGSPPSERIIISKKTLDKIGLFFINGDRNNTIKTRMGTFSSSKKIKLLPFEKKLVFLDIKPTLIPVKHWYKLNLVSLNQAKTQVRTLIEPYETAHAYLNLKNWKNSIVYLKKTVERDPFNCEAYLFLFIAYKEVNEQEKALTILNKLKEINPKYLEDYYRLALTPEGKIWKKKFQELFPVDPDLLRFRLASIYQAEKSRFGAGSIIQDGDAEGDLARFSSKGLDNPESVIYGPYKEFPPGWYHAHFYLKVDELINEEIAKIEVSCSGGKKILAEQKVKGIDFKNNFSYQNFELIFYNDYIHNELEFRVTAYGGTNLWIDKVVIEPDIKRGLGKNISQFYIALGDIYQDKGEYEKATRAYRKAETLIPEEPTFHKHLADYFITIGSVKNAIEEYQKALELCPTNLDTLNRLKELYRMEGNTLKVDRLEIAIKNLLPEEPKSINFGNIIQFMGYKIDNDKLKPGQTFNITYYWNCLNEIDRNLCIFVHFTKTNGKVIFQNDHEPLDYTYPTSLWAPGEIIKESYEITAPCNILPGTYDIRIGVWDPYITKKRIEVTKTNLPFYEERVIIGKIEIE